MTFFKEPDSKDKLLRALNGREVTLGFTEPKDFKEKIQAVKTAMADNWIVS